MQKTQEPIESLFKCIGHDEIRIRALLDDQLEAIQSQDTEMLLNCYADDDAALDMVQMLENFHGPVRYDVQDLNIEVGEDVAFGHSVDHFRGKGKNGRTMDRWMKHMYGLKKVDGNWRIAAELFSLPIELHS